MNYPDDQNCTRAHAPILQASNHDKTNPTGKAYQLGSRRKAAE